MTTAHAYIPYTLYKGTLIDVPELGKIRIRVNYLLGVTSDGIIDFILDAPSDNECVALFVKKYPFDKVRHNFRFVDLSGSAKFLFPGFVDTHIHASQYPNVGIGLNIELLDWLKIYTFPLENTFNAKNLKFVQDVYSKVIKKTLSCGTTCASYFATIDTETSKLFGDLLLKYGQRGFVGKVCMNHNELYPDYQEPREESIESMKELIEYFNSKDPHRELIKPIITPRFAPVCSRELLGQLGELSIQQQLPIQTHISENKGEIELVKKLFPESNSYADVYDNHNLLRNNTILAHAIHLTKDERDLIKEKKCSISHCPTSNTFISSGEACVKQYLYEDNINVSLGTDVSGGWDASILGIVKQSILVSHHLSMHSGKNFDKLSLNDSLYMSTMGGAIAMGLETTIGSFEIGKRFDCQVIDLTVGIDLFSWQLPNQKPNPRLSLMSIAGDDLQEQELKWLNLLNKWVFCGDDRNCGQVYVNGRKVVDKHKY